MSEYFTCPHCNQPHRAGARFCPATGKPITSPIPQPTPAAGRQAAIPPAASGPAVVAPLPASGGPLTGQLPANTYLNNRYIIIQKIGQGGMAAVYKTLDVNQPGVIWAVKEMSDAALTSLEERQYAVEAFQREAALLRALDHPNLPKVTDFFTERGKHYLVMEFVQGQTLDKMLVNRGVPFSEAEILPWAIQLCDVLHYLHSQVPPIIFRDLKPGNIMLAPASQAYPQGQVKLIDFGIVRFFKPGKTKDTQALGTPGFFAPEATSGQTDARSDIYSLCVTLHQLLTVSDPATRMFSLPTARSLNPAISPGMDQVLQRGLQTQRELRWGSTQELRAQFVNLAAQSGQIPIPPAGWGTPAIQPNQGAQAAPFAQGGFTPTAYPAGSLDQPGMYAQETIPAPPPTVAAVQGLKPLGSRPTTRLIMAAAKLSAWQLGLLLVSLVIGLVVAAWLVTPLLDNLPIDWNQFPIMAAFGALGYAAYPKRLVAFLSHCLPTIALVATIWARTGQGYTFWILLLAGVLSGLIMEAWVFFLPKLKGERGAEAWLRELIWLALMAVIGTITFFVTVSTFRLGLSPLSWFFAAVFGAAGWFIGDLFNQYITFRQTGFKRVR